MKNLFLLLFLTWIFSPYAFAKEPGFWRYWTVIDGLQEAWCETVSDGSSGNIWINHGQAVDYSSRYDGYMIHPFPKPGHVFPIVEGPGHSLWVHDSNHSNIIHYFADWNDGLNGEWVAFTLPHSLLRSFLFPVSNTRVLYFTEENRIVEFNRETQATHAVFDVRDSSVEVVNHIFQGMDGGLWISGNKGLHKLQISESTDRAVSVEDHWFPDTWEKAPTIFTFENSNGVVSGAIIHSPTRFEGVMFDGKQFLDFNQIFDVASMQSWFLLEDGRVLNLMNGRFVKTRREHVMTGEVLHLNLDSKGNFWYATNQGLAKYSPSLWQTPEGIESLDTIVHSIHQQSDGSLWFLSPTQLVGFQNEEWKTIDTPKQYPSLYFQIGTLGSIPENRIYYAANRSIVAYDLNTQSFEIISNTISHSLRYFLKPYNAHQLLVCDMDAYSLGVFDGTTFKPFLQNRQIKQAINGIRDVVIDQAGITWIGGIYGLNRFDPEGEHFPFIDDNQPTFGAVNSLLETREGMIWAGSSNAIWQFDGSHWTEIRSNLDRVNQMISMPDGSIWVASYSGLHQYRDGSWITYTEEDGLPSRLVYTVFRSEDGNLWAGTSSGISKFHPEADTEPPRVEFDPNNPSETSPKGNAQFVYSAVDKWKYTKEERLYYSYRVDENPWSSFVMSTVAQVQNLTPGRHVLQVRAMDRNWNQSDFISWTFAVPRPWYQEPLFWTSSVLGILLTAFFAGIAWRRHHLLIQSNHLLHQANEELKQLDQMKSAFVSQASHDLRTPLTAIKGSLDNLILGIAGEVNNKQKKIMERAIRSVERLANLVNDVLDLHRIESGRAVLDKAKVPFNLLVENSVNENRPAAALKNIELFLVQDQGNVTLHIDGGKMERVVGELISNAIKYTHEHGEVEVRLNTRKGDSPGESFAQLYVQDTGIGMTQEECTKIWDRFYRTKGSKKLAKGTGLGLSIAKELVEMHGGKIEVESQQGRGTTFTLILPNLHQ